MRACEALRKALRDEAGLDPSLEIQRLERRVLDQDPTLVATDAGFMTPLPAWTAETLAFVGRDAQCQQLVSRLAEAVGGTMRLALVEGAAGVGKSRFLLHIARQFARDAIVLPIHVHDVFSPALHTFARVIAEATTSLSDDEMNAIIADLPDGFVDIATVREVTTALVAGESLAGFVRDEEVLRGAAPWIAALSATRSRRCRGRRSRQCEHLGAARHRTARLHVDAEAGPRRREHSCSVRRLLTGVGADGRRARRSRLCRPHFAAAAR